MTGQSEAGWTAGGRVEARRRVRRLSQPVPQVVSSVRMDSEAGLEAGKAGIQPTPSKDRLLSKTRLGWVSVYLQETAKVR